MEQAISEIEGILSSGGLVLLSYSIEVSVSALKRKVQSSSLLMLDFDLAILDRGRGVAPYETAESYGHEIPTQPFLGPYPTNYITCSNNRCASINGRVQGASLNGPCRSYYKGLAAWRSRNHFPIRPPRPRFGTRLGETWLAGN